VQAGGGKTKEAILFAEEAIATDKADAPAEEVAKIEKRIAE
jgi:hypothetical protein